MTTKRKITNSNLPKRWVSTTISNVCKKPQYGWTSKASQTGTLKYLRTTDITPGQITWDTVPYCLNEPDDVAKYLLEDGDVVISRAGSVGYSLLVKKPQKAVFASYLIRFNPLIEQRYFAYFLKSPSYWQAISEKKLGIAVQNVNATKLKEICIPIPPLGEQERIVGKVEKLFSDLDAGVAALEVVKKEIKRYRQAVLKNAFEGKLTEKWRKENKDKIEPASKLLERIAKEREKQTKGKKQKKLPPLDVSILSELPESWEWAQSNDIFYFVTSGSRGWAKYYSDKGKLFLRMGNLDHDSITLDLEKIQYVTPPKGAEGSRTQVCKGDILISVTADVGMTALVPESIPEAYVNQHVALARTAGPINRHYVAWYIACRDGGQQQFITLRRGATKAGLGLDDIRGIAIPVPSLVEQEAIISEIERCFSIADQSEKIVEEALKQSQRLRQSILKRAFEGKLVPQDPNEEPAQELLERMKKERH